MRVAVVHYWLVGMRGGERVLEQILACHPGADIFTHVADPARLSDAIRAHRIEESFVGRLPGARRHYQKYLGLMPRALEELDLSGYDLVISSESGPAKGVLAPPGACHICYCHTPMRYIYDHYHAYKATLGAPGRAYFSRLAHRLRQWDQVSAARLDGVLANSSFTAARVRRFWGRGSRVVHPPADLDSFSPGTDGLASDAPYIAVSELVSYKRIDTAVAAFSGLDRQLLVVGDGAERQALARRAPANVRFLGRLPMADLRDLYRSARGLIFPGEEDFGIVPIEAMACGCPVLAYGSGGVRDSVVEGRTGLFFDRQSPEAVREAIARFEARRFDRAAIAAHASGYSNAAFRQNFQHAVAEIQNARGGGDV